MCIGPGDRMNELFLIDYNMARRFLLEDNKPVDERSNAYFRGTFRYASLTTHRSLDQSPRDDIVGLLYTLSELHIGSLPWSDLKDKGDIAERKESTGLATLFPQMPSMHEFNKLLDPLKFAQLPDYEAMKALLLKCLPDGKLDPTTKLDWECP